MGKKNEETGKTKRWQRGLEHGGKGLAIVGFFMLLLIVVMGAYTTAYKGKILPGVKIVGVEVGNMTGEVAAGLVKSKIENEGFGELTLVSGESEWIVDSMDLSVVADIPAVISQAWMVGRSEGLLERFGQAQRSYFEGIDIPLVLEIDGDKWEEMVANVAASLDDPEIEPGLRLEEDGESQVVVFEPGKNGLTVDQDKLREVVEAQWSRLAGGEIEIPVDRISVKVDEEKIEAAKALAGNLLGKELVVTFEDESWILEEEELLELVSVREGGVDTKQVVERVELFTEGVNREPQNAAFEFVGGRVEEFRPGKDGLLVLEEKLVVEIAEGILTLAGEDELSIGTPVERTSPSITTAEVNDMGINELLGVGKSTYFHSIPNRIHNVGLASRRISGVLIAPGEVFSFNQALGDVSQATGFKSAYVISGGRTILGDGGGVCQVSTTLFRAIMDAGLPIVERKAHSYRVGYYEQDSKPGIDATVYSPTVDLKFKNDTPGHLLIQTIVNESNLSLRYEIYGTNDGRVSYVSEPKVWGISAAPPPLYQDDPTLPVGVTKQIDWAASGAKTSFDYSVTRNGETLYEKTFYSSFRPWQAVYLVGTKQG